GGALALAHRQAQGARDRGRRLPDGDGEGAGGGHGGGGGAVLDGEAEAVVAVAAGGRVGDVAGVQVGLGEGGPHGGHRRAVDPQRAAGQRRHRVGQGRGLGGRVVAGHQVPRQGGGPGGLGHGQPAVGGH